MCIKEHSATYCTASFKFSKTITMLGQILLLQHKGKKNMKIALLQKDATQESAG
jgi:hypothetical protein